jgi:hypothetical protein
MIGDGHGRRHNRRHNRINGDMVAP